MSGGIARRLVIAFTVLWPTFLAARGAKSADSGTAEGREPPARLSFEDSCRKLQALELLEAGGLPKMPARKPAFDDEELGVSFFRTEMAEVSLEDLTLPRTFFGRSEIREVTFRNTDLSESNLCWNDFMKVDFSDACLAGSDMRASLYEEVSFRRADLSRADLRHSKFERCDFSDASMAGAVVGRDQVAALNLSAAQSRMLDLRANEGPEPDGG
jgi:uncharacterized protein YjbI with pentapeptide repeats